MTSDPEREGPAAFLPGRRTSPGAASLVAATLMSALLYGLAFPPTTVRLLAWVGLTPLLVAIRSASRLSTALLLAWLWGVVAAYVVGDWFPRAVSVYYNQPVAVGIGFFLGISTFMAGIHYMGFAASYRALARRPGPALPLLAAAAWVAFELSRSRLLTGNPWALAGYSQVGLPAVVQIADVAGVYGVSFVLVAVNTAIAESWLALRNGSPTTRRVLVGTSLAASSLALVLVYGVARLAGPPGPRAGSRPVTIAVVQGNLDLGTQWRSEFYGKNLEVYLRLTNEVLRESRPEVVFWPESAMTFFLDQEPLYRAAIARVTEPRRTELVAGGPRAVGTSNPVYYNTAFLLSPEGVIRGHYDKQRLLPFAEYFPVRSLDLLHRRFGRVREFAAGATTPLLDTAAGRAGALICNEAMFPELGAARVRDGADYLVNLSNETWVDDAKFAAIVSNTVSLRAIEQRRYLVRASTSGPSAIVDPLGRVTTATAPQSRGILVGQVQASSTRTPYALVGDSFAVGCALVVALALAAGRARAQR